MALDTKQRQQITYFLGNEIEHTACHGQATLFVVGQPDLEEVLVQAGIHKVTHIYFGASQSFHGDRMAAWSRLIKGCLAENYWVSLDFDSRYADLVMAEGWSQDKHFVPIISVKLPKILSYNYNTTVKLDDVTWGATNPGVWCHDLHSLMAINRFTGWDQYKADKSI